MWPRRSGAWLAMAIGMTGHPTTGSALSVSPTVVEIRAAPGSQARGAFQVSNETGQRSAVSVRAVPLGVPGPVPSAVEEWLTVSPPSFELGPAEAQEVRYTVSVPPDAEGELSAEVVFAYGIGEGGSAGIEVHFGVALYVAVAGTERVTLRVGPLSVEPQASLIRIPITNEGNVHCRPEGIVVVRDPADMARAEGAFGRGFPALPGRREVFDAHLPIGTLPAGAYQILAAGVCHVGNGPPHHWAAREDGTLDDTGAWHRRELSVAPGEDESARDAVR